MENKALALPYEDFMKLIDRPSLRDQFAMAALQGLLGHDGKAWTTEQMSYDDYAIAAYMQADAMLEARK